MEKRNAINLNNQGARHFLHGDLEKALDCYQQALAIYPDNASLLNNLGLYFHHKNDFNQAIDYFKKALDQESKPNFWLNYGNAIAMTGDFDKANSIFLKVAENHPDLSAAWLSLAKLAGHLERHAEAIAYWKELLKLQEEPEYILGLAQSYIHQKNYEGALEVLYDYDIDYKHSELWFCIGQCEFHLRNHGTAERAFKICLSTQPDQLEYRHFLAVNYLAKGESVKGLQELEQILKVDPDNHHIITEKGIILASLNQYEEAIQLLDRALEIEPAFNKAIHYKNLIENQSS
ncbi:hypothetical protein GCM10007049_07390 [Echinicola pacifica]|uniref:Tetratricopeptide repeat protein n=1 Tax=Echinicola pacifica TaxID=346377 RepID=A0A918UKY3_9BACT|nr:tetratricopeptide repeat protein [Echinicola pacifica]GGZ17410.1 hypothetical protein GCM10007049_07390 [Echinicola pacifica]